MNPLICLTALLLVPAADSPRQTMIIVVGTAGTPEYGESFATWADRWKVASKQAEIDFIRIGSETQNEISDRERLKECLTEEAAKNTKTLWLVLIGHGTFDGQRAKFNLRGRDVTASEIGKWLEPIDVPVAVVNCASASGPFINELSAPNRVIVTATKSGFEHNFARFGDYLSSAIADESIDLDKDRQISLLEAYLAASSKTAEFYEQDARLATEHALLDDNGDSLGTPADWFRGFRAVRSGKDGAADGLNASRFVLVPSAEEAELSAETRQERDRLEQAVEELRGRKGLLAEVDYFAELEQLMIELAKLYQ